VREDERAAALDQITSAFPVIQTRRRLQSIPWITMSELLGSRRCRIVMDVIAYEDGITPLVDTMVLLAVLVAEQPEVVLEIGTYMGHTTRAMAENLEGSRRKGSRLS
jgi:predicted O-methyltransferase YrrM